MDVPLVWGHNSETKAQIKNPKTCGPPQWTTLANGVSYSCGPSVSIEKPRDKRLAYKLVDLSFEVSCLTAKIVIKIGDFHSNRGCSIAGTSGKKPWNSKRSKDSRNLVFWINSENYLATWLIWNPKKFELALFGQKSSFKGVFHVLGKCLTLICHRQNLELSLRAAVADLGPTQEPFGLETKNSWIFFRGPVWPCPL